MMLCYHELRAPRLQKLVLQTQEKINEKKQKTAISNIKGNDQESAYFKTSFVLEMVLTITYPSIDCYFLQSAFFALSMSTPRLTEVRSTEASHESRIAHL